MRKVAKIAIIVMICMGLTACTDGNATNYSSSTSKGTESTYSNSTSKGTESTYSSQKSNSSSESKKSESKEPGGPGLCKYKEGGNFVCTKPATNGNYCKTHYDYLNDAYNSLTGN